MSVRTSRRESRSLFTRCALYLNFRAICFIMQIKQDVKHVCFTLLTKEIDMSKNIFNMEQERLIYYHEIVHKNV